jgi:hypothetical protein
MGGPECKKGARVLHGEDRRHSQTQNISMGRKNKNENPVSKTPSPVRNNGQLKK